MGALYLGLELLQSVVLFGTLGSGFLVLLFMMLDKCKHNFIFVVITTTGLVHELYCASVLGYFKRLMQFHNLNPDDEGCRDFFSVTLIANAIFISVLLMHAISASLYHANKVIRNIVIIHIIVTVFFLISINPDKSLNQSSSLNITQDMQLYFTVCRTDVVQNLMHNLLEYCLLYTPVVFVLSMIAWQRPSANGFTFWNIDILIPCVNKPNECCNRCESMNYTLQIVLFYMGVGILVARPAELLYGYTHDTPIIDVIPSLTNTVVYSFMSLEYLTDFMHIKHLYNTM